MAAEVLDGETVRRWCRLGVAAPAAGRRGEAAAAIAARLLSRGGELITLMEGTGVQPGLARRTAGHVSRACPQAEVVCYEGGPVPLLIGVE
jgi:hypothetical protein